MIIPVMPWLNMSAVVSPVMIIANRMILPAGMPAFPVMKTIQAVGIGHDPDIARPQIIILAAHETDVLIPIPSISIRHQYHRLGLGRIYNWWCDRNNKGLKCQTSIGFNHTAGYQHQAESCQ